MLGPMLKQNTRVCVCKPMCALVSTLGDEFDVAANYTFKSTKIWGSEDYCDAIYTTDSYQTSRHHILKARYLQHPNGHGQCPCFCSFLQSHVTSSLFSLNILLNALFSNTLSLCSSLNSQGPVKYKIFVIIYIKESPTNCEQTSVQR
jgi:hypothetical protein